MTGNSLETSIFPIVVYTEVTPIGEIRSKFLKEFLFKEKAEGILPRELF